MLVRRIADLFRRVFWALGAVQVCVKPEVACLSRGGLLPLTIVLKPKPYYRTILTLEVNQHSIANFQRQIVADANCSEIQTEIRGDHTGNTELTIRLFPTSRFGDGIQSLFSKLAATFGFGFVQMRITVGSPPIFVVAPHPDDEAVMASGIIASSISKEEPVKVVVVTNGDHKKGQKTYGLKRQSESVAAMELLGLRPEDVIFLGYPGDTRELLYLMNNYQTRQEAYTSTAGARATYGAHGLGSRDFHSWLTGKPALYNGLNLHLDLEQLIKAFRPEHLYTSSRFDEHPEHRAVYYFLVRALQSIQLDDPSYAPTLHTAVIHDVTANAYDDFWERDKYPPTISVDFKGDDFWPVPTNNSESGDGDEDSLLQSTPPPNLWRTSLAWSNVERFPVPLSMRTNNLENNLKYQVLRKYASQAIRYLAPFCKQDEIFWQEDLPRTRLLALAPPILMLKESEAYVLAVSLVRPAPRTTAIALESSDETILSVPSAVVIHTGMMTATFPIKGVKRGEATVSANLDARQILATVIVVDSREPLFDPSPVLAVQ